MELTWHDTSPGITITQKALIQSMASQYLKGEPQPRHSLPINPNLYEESQDNVENIKQNQAVTGGLLYIARMIRPEISIHDNLLGRKTSKPMKAALRIPSNSQS